MFAPKPVQGTIASVVACLEALFLGDTSGSGEIAFRLAQRAALLLGRYGWPSLDVRNMLKAAYRVRSSYVHGALPNKKLNSEELDQMFRATAEHARVACLLILQMTKIHQKDHAALSKALDDAMIDDSTRKQLDDWCSIVEFGQKTSRPT